MPKTFNLNRNLAVSSDALSLFSLDAIASRMTFLVLFWLISAATILGYLATWPTAKPWRTRMRFDIPVLVLLLVACVVLRPSIPADPAEAAEAGGVATISLHYLYYRAHYSRSRCSEHSSTLYFSEASVIATPASNQALEVTATRWTFDIFRD